jgi:predicted NAD/FAD-binding protein
VNTPNASEQSETSFGREDVMRIGIAGAGTAGMATAWLLDGAQETVVLEARAAPGGNARSLQVRADGRRYRVDLGVHLVSDKFPLWARLVDLAGLGDGALRSTPGSRSMRHAGAPVPFLVTPHEPAVDRKREVILGPAWDALTHLGREAVGWESEDLDWETTFGEATRQWPLDGRTGADLFEGLPASVFGCGLHDTRSLSARAIGGLFAASEMSTAHAAPMHTMRDGAQELAYALADKLTTTRLHLQTPLHRIERSGGGFAMVDASGSSHLVDSVVLALPAYAACDVLDPLAGTTDVRSLLSSFSYQSMFYGVHLDPFGMPEDRRHWSSSNVTLHNGWSETTTWYGPEQDAPLFVSQLTHREERPRRLIATSVFRGLLPTPAAYRARQQLDRHQGREGVYFAGAYTRGLDLQEDAVASAVDVVRRLDPDNPRIAQLVQP